MQFQGTPFRAGQAAHQAQFDVFLRLQLEHQAVRRGLRALRALEQPVVTGFSVTTTRVVRSGRRLR